MQNRFNKNFLTRVLSALVLVGILAGTQIFFGRQGILVLGILVIALGIVEFSRLMFASVPEQHRAHVKFIFVMTQFAALFCVLVSRLVFSPFPVVLLLLGMGLTFWRYHRSMELPGLFQIMATFMMGFLYLPLLSMTALQLLHSPVGEVFFWFMIVTVVVTDSAAYLSGLMWGKEKLSPNVSPKKSWVGFWGGLTGAAMVGFIFAQLHPEVVTLPLGLGAATVGSLSSQTGDLFESLLKRCLNVKDSGDLIPGHGGILDRLDGILFAAPIFAAAYLL